MVQHFNPSSDWPHRAVQAWMILVGMAMNRQTTTYTGLSDLMYGKEAAGVLGSILGHVAYYCEDNFLPQLNVLVVGKDRGTPGDLIPLDPSDIDAIREAVYTTNWYDVVPPAAEELAAAFNSRKKKAG
jgi:hypothetical protein